MDRGILFGMFCDFGWHCILLLLVEGLRWSMSVISGK